MTILRRITAIKVFPLQSRILFSIVLLHYGLSMNGQLKTLNYETDGDLKTEFLEVVMGVKSGEAEMRYNVNLISYKVKDNYFLDLVPFLDFGFSQTTLGFRLSNKILISDKLHVDIAPGIILKGGHPFIHRDRFSHEISIMRNNRFGISGTISFPVSEISRNTINYGLGIKVKGTKNTITSTGIAAALYGMLYLAIRNSI